MNALMQSFGRLNGLGDAESDFLAQLLSFTTPVAQHPAPGGSPVLVLPPTTPTPASLVPSPGEVSSGPLFDLPGVDPASLPASSPNAPAVWPPRNVSVIKSLGYNCIPSDWPQPIDGSYPYCSTGQSPQTPVNNLQEADFITQAGALFGNTAPGQQAAAAIQAAQQASAAQTSTPPVQSNPQAAQVTPSVNATTQSVYYPTFNLINLSDASSPRSFQIGQSWKVTITGAPANATISVTASQNGNSLGTTPIGTADAQGNFTASSPIDASMVGVWSEQWYAGQWPVAATTFTVYGPGGTTTPAATSTGSGAGSGSTGTTTTTPSNTSTPSGSVADGTVTGGVDTSVLPTTGISSGMLLALGIGAAALFFFGGSSGGGHHR